MNDRTRVQLNAARTAAEKAHTDRLRKTDAREAQLAEKARERGTNNHSRRG